MPTYPNIYIKGCQRKKVPGAVFCSGESYTVSASVSKCKNIKIAETENPGLSSSTSYF